MSLNLSPSDRVIFDARKSSELCGLLEQFFVEQTQQVYHALRACEPNTLVHHQAYLQALSKLEEHLLSFIQAYEITEARRLHVRE